MFRKQEETVSKIEIMKELIVNLRTVDAQSKKPLIHGYLGFESDP